MRGMTRAVVRSAVVSMALVLAVPAQAKPRDGGRWFERKLDPVAKIIQKFVVKTLGDGLSDPRP